MRRLAALTLATTLACSGGADEDAGPPPCGSMTYGLSTVIASPGQDGFDAELDAEARRHDRLFAAVFSRATGLNADYRLVDNTPENKALFEAFVAGDGWDFEAVTGVAPEDVGEWGKSAGLYGGVGVAADAYRYGALRDLGAACSDVAQARAQLVRGLEALDLATKITGTPGVNARALVNTAFPSAGHRAPTPLFDAAGNPLPEEKNNGEWRADVSGDFEGWVWEDSLSRDMLVGWAAAYAAAWEVIGDDPELPAELKARLQDNARATGHALMQVGDSGYDLEIPDADGRLTFHAYMNENAIDRLYLEDAGNGFNAIMALGIISALAYASEDAAMQAYLHDELVARRELPRIAADDMLFVNVGVGSNFSNYNMAFTGMWLTQRYLDDEVAEPYVRNALETELWRKPEAGEDRQPADMGQSFFDVIYAAGKAGSKAGRPGDREVPADAVATGLQTLRDFPDAPFFDREVINCDEAEEASGTCVLLDGTTVEVLGDAGWKGTKVTREIIPMAVRPPSNFHWRTTPYKYNGGSDSGGLFPAVDFRIAYWLGRWARVAAP